MWKWIQKIKPIWFWPSIILGSTLGLIWGAVIVAFWAILISVVVGSVLSLDGESIVFFSVFAFSCWILVAVFMGVRVWRKEGMSGDVLRHRKLFIQGAEARRVMKATVRYIYQHAQKTALMLPGEAEKRSEPSPLGEDVRTAFQLLTLINGAYNGVFGRQERLLRFFGGGGCVVDLSGADLRYLDLRGVVWVKGCCLRGANLQGADLRGADLRGVDLRDSNLQGAKLEGTKR